MKKLFLFAGIAIILGACNQSKSSETSGKEVNQGGTAIMKFEKSVYDFGKITQGEKVSYDFVFTNTGKSPLIISNAVASCGCTVPNPPNEPIAPGEKSKINVVFSSAGKMGLQDKVVTITANTVPAQSEIQLVGEVLKK